MTKHIQKFQTTTALSGIPTDLETKDNSSHGGDGEVGELMTKFMMSFEEFKKANDIRLKEIESRGTADVLSEEKTNRINTALTEMQDGMKEVQKKADTDKSALEALEKEILTLKRAPKGGDGAPNAAMIEYKEAYQSFLRGGIGGITEDEMRIAEKKAIEMKALSSGSDPDGGFVVPTIVETSIYKKVEVEHSAFRRFCSVQNISTSQLKKIVQLTGVSSGWVGETDARPNTDTPTLAEIIFNTMEIYAQPITTQTFLDDSAVNVDSWIAGEVAEEFAYQETQAFVLGDGILKPKGILAQTVVADSAWAWNKIGSMNSGSAASLGANPLDLLIDLITLPKKKFRGLNSRLLMNKLTMAELRKVKNANGDYIWTLGDVTKGIPNTILGHGVEEIDEMPDIAANTYPIAFGDFKRAYLIVDRIGIRILRDPYTSKPYIKFYTTKRVGGGVQDYEAYKLLKVAA